MAAACGLWLAALAGLWHPSRVGLPPAALPTLPATRAAIAALTLPFSVPDIPALRLPALSIPAIRVPETAPPPLSVQADATARPVPGGGSVWEVRGTVVNPGRRALPVPPLDIILTSEHGVEVARWTAHAEATSLEPGGIAPFATSAINPPADARHLIVRLRPASVARL